MQDPRKIRQAIQTIVGLAMIVSPVALAIPFDWRALVVAALGGIMTLLTNPRLVPGLASAMPASGSSSVPPAVSAPPRFMGGPAAFVILTILALGVPSCHNITPDQFLGATVDCAKANPEASAALAQVETCLVGALAQNPAVCLSGLVTEIHFAVDEVACVVAYIAQRNQAKVALRTATGDDLRARQAANDWLVRERISIRNSYRSGR
jgi:hypothetical protein